MQRNQQVSYFTNDENCSSAALISKRDLLLNKLHALADENFMVDQLVEEFIAVITSQEDELYDNINRLCDVPNATNILAQFFGEIFRGDLDNMRELIGIAYNFFVEHPFADSIYENVTLDRTAEDDDTLSLSDLVIAPQSPNFDLFLSDSATDYSDDESIISSNADNTPSEPTAPSENEDLNNVHSAIGSLLPSSALSLFFPSRSETRRGSLINPPITRQNHSNQQ